MAPARTRAVYTQIADELRSKIIRGALEQGAQLPTESALAEQYSVNRNTIRQAVGVLVNEGLVESVRPKGHFVRTIRREYHRPQAEFRPRPATSELDQWMEDQHQAGRVPSQTITVEIVTASPAVAYRLKLEPDSLVVVRRRVRYLDGEPSYINDSYFPHELANGTEIAKPADIGRGANEVLKEMGSEQIRAIDEVEARAPLPDEVARLDLGPGSPVLVVRTTGYTADDRPVRTVINVFPGTAYTVAYERMKNAEQWNSIGGNP
jgi:DNA-binding GntR family transcriptional regulator